MPVEDVYPHLYADVGIEEAPAPVEYPAFYANVGLEAAPGSAFPTVYANAIDPTYARLARQDAEVVFEPDPDARLARQDLEVLFQSTDVAARLGRQTVEVVQAIPMTATPQQSASAYAYDNVGVSLTHTSEGYAYAYENIGVVAAHSREATSYIYENVINAIGTGTSAVTSSASGSLSLAYGLAGTSVVVSGVAGREGAVGTVTVELYEAGTLVYSFGEVEITEEGVISLRWDAALLELLSGADVELRIEGESVDIGSVLWVAYNETGPRFATSGTLALQGEPEPLDGVIAAQTSVSGDLTLAYSLQGSTAGETSVTAVFGIIIPLTGTTSTNTDASGVLARLVGLIAATAGVTEVSGVLFVAILSGITNAQTTATGDLLMYYVPPSPPLQLTTATSGVRVGVRY